MMRRAVVGVGKALRETGQAMERMGCRAQDNWIFQEKFSRHRAVMNLFDQRPSHAPNTFIAPSASVVGNVELKPHTSVWYGAIIRGDQSNVSIGGMSSIGDRSVVQSSPVNPTGFSARTHVGDWVTIGKGCVLRGCTVENYCLVGDGSILQEGSLMEVNSILEPGSVLPAGARVPEGQVYGGNPAQFVRKLEKEEIAQIESVGDDMAVLAAKHADEFLPYGTNYQLREKM